MPKDDQVTFENRIPELLSRIKESTRKEVHIGIIGNQESFFAMLLGVHEFGTDRAGKNHNVTIPARSPIRRTVNNKRKMKKAVEKANAVFDLVTPVKQILNGLGLTIASEVRKKIRTNLPPKLKPATIRRKGSSIALIDDGAMINRIQHEVV